LPTHCIEEAERLRGRIVFILKGRIVRTDTAEALVHETEGRHVVRFAVSDGAAGLCDLIAGESPQLRCRESWPKWQARHGGPRRRPGPRRTK
jgi:ABC-type multidrug transport system ATPase subunit